MDFIISLFKDSGNINLGITLSVLFLIWAVVRRFWKFSFFDIICVYISVGFLGALVFYNVIKTNYMEIPPSDIKLSPLLYCMLMLVMLALPFANLRLCNYKIRDEGLIFYGAVQFFRG